MAAAAEKKKKDAPVKVPVLGRPGVTIIQYYERMF
jgi:hypothetical protein